MDEAGREERSTQRRATQRATLPSLVRWEGSLDFGLSASCGNLLTFPLLSFSMLLQSHSAPALTVLFLCALSINSLFYKSVSGFTSFGLPAV